MLNWRTRRQQTRLWNIFEAWYWEYICSVGNEPYVGISKVVFKFDPTITTIRLHLTNFPNILQF